MEKKNIVLIGMPGAGKSTVGVLLAKSALMDFIDTDLIIQNLHGKSLCEIIDEKGTEEFLKIENDAICSFDYTNCVVATGGSAVYGEDAMQKLREKGVTVYLDLPLKEIKKRLSDIHSRGVAMKNGSTVEELYKERIHLYRKYADITVDCSGLTAEMCVEKILSEIK